MTPAEHTVLDRPGLCGTLGSAEHPGGRVLITDDRAAPVLETLIAELPAQIVLVFSAAERCRRLIEQTAGWYGEPATAMICRDLAHLSECAMPAGLSVRTVHRAPQDPDDGVPLDQAAQACLRADPRTADVSLPAYIGVLQALPSNTRLFAAVDSENRVCATAGSSALGSDAHAYFVSTDRQWRGRGVATAMTTTALGWAYRAGAREASLDASPPGVSIYLRLGFEPVSDTTLFTRFG